MLRRLTSQNFVNFRNGIDITFQQGPNYFIGRCATGKSASLELIRRCHHDNINVSTISTISNSTQNAYAFCLYENIENSESLDIKAILTGIYIGPSAEDNVKDKKLIYKFAIVEYEHEKCCVYTKVKEESNTAHESIYFNFELTENEKKDFKPSIIEGEKFCQLIDLMKMKKDGKTCIESCYEGVPDMDIDKVLGLLLKQFASTMSHRGISPVMWTGQLEKKIIDKEKLCSEAMTRADILRVLLNDNEDVDQDKAKKIYRDLSPEKFEFVMEGHNIYVIDPSGAKVPLIRAPAGVYEAKQLSLLLAHKKIRTLCLEEPSRSMHHDMTRKLGQLILPRQTDKTIVIVSHEKALVSPCSLERTHVFKNSRRDDLVNHEVIEFPSCSIKYGLDEEMKTVLFSHSVLLVEGDTDRIILQSLFNQIISETKPTNLKNLLSQISTKMKIPIDLIETTFARIDIVKLGSDKAGLDRLKFCKAIDVQCVLLLDRVAVFEKRYFPCCMKKIYSPEEDNSKSVRIQTENDWKSQYGNFSKCLGKDGIFVWKEGDIEDVLLSEIASDDDIYSKMELSLLVRESKDSKTAKDDRKSWKKKLSQISFNLGDVNQLVISVLGQNNKESSFSLLIEFLLCKFCN